MKRFIYICAVLLTAYLSACKKELQETPSNTIAPENFYKTKSDFELATLGTFGVLQGTSLYAWYIHYVMEYQSGDLALPAGTTWTDLNWVTTDGFVAMTWTGHYNLINNANTALDKIDAVSFDKASKDALKGELYFLRAVGYFNLVRMFGRIPLHLNATTSPTDASLPQSEISVVYDAIVSDLQQAENLLPVNNPYGLGRANKGAAAGVLAKVYVFMAGYPLNNSSKWNDALVQLKKIIEPSNPSRSVAPFNYSLEPDYQNLYWQVLKLRTTGTGLPTFGKPANENGPEAVFEINYKRAGGYYSAIFPSSLIYQGCSNWLYNQFEPNDYRRSVTMVDTPNDPLGGVTLQRKFQATGNTWNDNENNWPYLRYADLVLLFAEVENEVNGPTVTALNAINAVRARARNAAGTQRMVPADYLVTQVPSKDVFRKLVLHERTLELSCEGQTWYDWIRTGTLKDVLTSQNRPNTYSKKILLYPIPESEMDITKGKLQQNADY